MGAPGTTPGPWWIDDRRPAGMLQVQAAHRGPGSSYCVASVNHWEQQEANAHQIAASGALYDALEGYLFAEEIDDEGIRQQELAAARQIASAALAFARGEQPA